MTASLASYEPTLVSQCTEASRLLLVTEALFLGEALAAALENRFRVVTVVCCDTGAALGLVAPVDALLVDAAHSDGVPTAKRLRQIAPALPIIAYGVREIEEEVVLWAEAGVTGYIPNTLELARLAHQITDILDGRQTCSTRAAAALFRRVAAAAAPLNATLPSSPVRSLTRREREVAELVAGGLSDKQIARELTISLATAKTHVHNLLGKLLVKQRREVFGILVADTGAPFRRPASLAAASRQLVLNPVH
jgi:DNA-binding NarL/FixJ family response regulator